MTVNIENVWISERNAQPLMSITSGIEYKKLAFRFFTRFTLSISSSAKSCSKVGVDEESEDWLRPGNTKKKMLINTDNILHESYDSFKK